MIRGMITVEEKVLQQMGLTEKEARIYLALLELGSGAVGEIAKKANIKRPTVYVVVEGLVKKGLVSEQPGGRGTVYIADDPAAFEKSAKQRLSDFSEMLPFLRAKFNRGKKPRIKYYEGKEAIENLYRHHVYPSEYILFYGSSMQKFTIVFREIFEEWNQTWWPKKKKHPERVKEIVGNEPGDVRYAKSLIGEREVRLAPKGMQFYADSVIADDTIFIVSLEHLFAISIESKDLADTYRTLVELAWRSAIPAEQWR